MIYLDYNATAPMKPAVTAAMVEAMERVGNASSVHRFGRIARKNIEEARARVGALVGVKPNQVIFTSSGTEANNLALRGVHFAQSAFSAIEHDSVLQTTKPNHLLPVTRDGVVDLAAAEQIISQMPPNSLISVMLVNNETGVIQPVAELAVLAKKYGHLIHTDAIQAAGRLPLDWNKLGVDMLTLSAHKIAGSQGVGALIVRENMPVQSLLKGGGQELNRRAGTENVAGIIGFGVAALLAADDLREMPRLAKMRDQIQAEMIKLTNGEHITVIGSNAPRVSNTLSIAMHGVSSETQVVAMDLAGTAVSAGSACSSGKVKASHVLQAMGFPVEVAGSALRISLGWKTEVKDLSRCISAWHGLWQRAHQSKKTETAAA